MKHEYEFKENMFFFFLFKSKLRCLQTKSLHNNFLYILNVNNNFLYILNVNTIEETFQLLFLFYKILNVYYKTTLTLKA